MSQIAPNKRIKEETIRLPMELLWNGKVVSAVIALKFSVPKNQTEKDELIGYLEKNQHYIIDYKNRKEAGKVIGSGRIEKENDLIIAKRQKCKAMAWSKKGSKSLAIVTAYFQAA